MSRIKQVRDGRIYKSIIRMRKKIKGDMRLRSVFDVVEEKEGLYVNRGLIGNRLEREGWVKYVDGVDWLVDEKVNRGR